MKATMVDGKQICVLDFESLLADDSFHPYFLLEITFKENKFLLFYESLDY